MARKGNTQPPSDSQGVPAYRVREEHVNLAYEAYSALQKTAAGQPYLLSNDYFKALQDTAYARFRAAFEAL